MTAVLVPRFLNEGCGCDIEELKSQIGLRTIYAISGGRYAIHRDKLGKPIGLLFKTATNRFIVIVYHWNDTYSVHRYRRVVKGANRGQFVVEFEQYDVYCDQISEVAYEASCFK